MKEKTSYKARYKVFPCIQFSKKNVIIFEKCLKRIFF